MDQREPKPRKDIPMTPSFFARRRSTRVAFRLVMIGAGLLFFAGAARAGAGLPWESQLDRVSDSLSGPVAKAIGLIAMVLCGIGIGLSEGGGGARKLLIIGLGLSVAFSARSFWLSFFGSSGGFIL
jgi:type IV secretory pathway VirB2 component (pilin)